MVVKTFKPGYTKAIEIESNGVMIEVVADVTVCRSKKAPVSSVDRRRATSASAAITPHRSPKYLDRQH